MKSIWVFVAVQLVLLVRAQDEAAPPEEEALKRCKHILCEKLCPEGFAQDDRGCDVCRCKNEPFACPLVACRINCEFGIAKDHNGCEKCQCKLHPCEGFRCEEGERCIAHNLCDAGKECPTSPKCVPDDGGEMQHGPDCPQAMCMMACEFGFKRDDRGCDICECNVEPCRYHLCPEGEMCQAREIHKGCDEPPCPVAPLCVVKPLCMRLREGRGVTAGMEKVRKPSCDEEGNFVPTQRDGDQFWCVDDRGVEVNSTRRTGMLTTDEPVCEQKHCKAVHVNFNLQHNLPNAKDHIKNLEKMAQKHLTKWLHVEEEYIIQLQVHPAGPNTLAVKFVVIRSEMEEEVDITSAAYHLHYQIQQQYVQMTYRGQAFIPDPHSVHMTHRYEPELPSDGGLRERDNGQDENDEGFLAKCYRKYGSGSIVSIVAASVLLLIVIIAFTCSVCVRRKRTRSDERLRTLRENLAFSNELYNAGQLGENEKSKLENPPLEAPEEEIDSSTASVA